MVSAARARATRAALSRPSMNHKMPSKPRPRARESAIRNLTESRAGREAAARGATQLGKLSLHARR